MKPGSDRSLIHDVIAVCQCKTRSSGFYYGDTQSFICGDCGAHIKKIEDMTVSDFYKYLYWAEPRKGVRRTWAKLNKF